MKLQVDRTIWHEVFSAARRYDEDRVGLGDEFIEAIDDSLQTILLSPQTRPVWPGIKQTSPPIQRYVMDRFPTRSVTRSSATMSWSWWSHMPSAGPVTGGSSRDRFERSRLELERRKAPRDLAAWM